MPDQKKVQKVQKSALCQADNTRSEPPLREAILAVAREEAIHPYLMGPPGEPF